MWSKPDACPTRMAHYCSCRPPGIVWTPHLTYYPQSTLVRIGPRLYKLPHLERIGLHHLDGHARVWAKVLIRERRILKFLIIYHTRGCSSHMIWWVPLHYVLTLQRWWRARRVRLAVGMALHPRLGAQSGLNALGPDLLRMCLPGPPARLSPPRPRGGTRT